MALKIGYPIRMAPNTQGKSNTFLITILLNALKIQQEGNLNL